MKDSREHASGYFHEMPLVVFSALVIIGAGLLAGHFVAWALGWVPWRPRPGLAISAAVLLASGLLISLLHLGRPARVAYALRRTGRNSLSNEVLAVLVILTATSAALILPLTSRLTVLIWSGVAFAAPGLLLLLGKVYRLPGQLDWQGPAVLSPILQGLAVGMLASAVSTPDNARLMFLGFVLLAVDAAGFGMRWLVMKWNSAAGVPTHPSLFRARRRMMILRLVDVNFLPALLLLAQAPLAAVCVLAFGLFVDRYAFYAFARRSSTEAEIAEIEERLRTANSRTGDPPMKKS